MVTLAGRKIKAGAGVGDSDAGCKARIGRANAAGGVNGRKVDVVYVDDQTSAANLTQAQDLVENQHVYLVVNDSPLAFLTYRWLLDHDVPLIGGGFDGNYYGAPGNEKVISAFGNSPPVATIQTTLTSKIMKSLGATKVAAVGYGNSPSSSENVKSFSKYAVPAVGLKSVYTNTSVDFGSVATGPLALAIKNAGADAAYYPMDLSTDLAIAQSLTQNNVHMKAELMPAGYGQALLDSPAARTFGPEIVLTSGWAPVELRTKATKRFQAELARYAQFRGVPDFGVYSGYIACDLVVRGLARQGKNPNPDTFAAELRSVGMVNPGDGLGCIDMDLSAATYGKIRLDALDSRKPCTWALQVKNDKFVVLKPPGGKTTYWTGDLIQQSVPPQYLVTTTTAGK